MKMITHIIAGGILMVYMAAGSTALVFAAMPFDLSSEHANETPAQEALICLDCHRMPNIHTNEGVIASQTFCYECHSESDIKKRDAGADISLRVTPETFHQNQPAHRFVACISCHTDIARSPHKTQTGATCRECHPVHSENAAHAPHLRVSCQACHFQSEFVRLDPADLRVKLAHTDYDNAPIPLSEHIFSDAANKETCKKCHFKNNPAGAPAAVLPSKSALCIICHNSPLAMGHPIFGIAGLIFLAGMFSMIAFWFKGSVKGEETSVHRKISLSSESIWNTLFSRKLFSLVKVVVLDILLQKRILKESVSRWSMHSLIFTAILLRFLLSLFTAIGFYFNPDGELMMALNDKNHWFTAFVNDLLGLFILLGILWAAVKRYFIKPKHVVSEYQDNIALIIIGCLVLAGFAVEGARILVTQISFDTGVYSFTGFAVSRLFSLFPLDWASVYPVLWYVHGVFAAIFVAYLPFGKMRHIFNTPLTYFIETVDGVKNEKRV